MLLLALVLAQDVDPVRDRRGAALDAVRSLKPAEVVVVKGKFDGVQLVLGRLGLPHSMLEADGLRDADLAGVKVLLVNCHAHYTPGRFRGADAKEIEDRITDQEGLENALRRRLAEARDGRDVLKISREVAEAVAAQKELRTKLEETTGAGRMVDRVRRFVEDGGFLFTSDWGLSILERAFPGTVKVGGNAGPRTVEIRPAAGKDGHALLDEVFWSPGKTGSTTATRPFQWEVDAATAPVKIVGANAVEVLVEAAALQEGPAVAVTFRPAGAKGRVLHVVSHFRRQAAREGDYAMQNLLINFLRDRVTP